MPNHSNQLYRESRAVNNFLATDPSRQFFYPCLFATSGSGARIQEIEERRICRRPNYQGDRWCYQTKRLWEAHERVEK